MFNIKRIAGDFSRLKDEILAILIYGSHINGNATIKSDIDICVVAGNKEEAKEPSYDIHIFELMPLYIQNEIINNSKIIFAKSLPELSYYFYFFRKLWQDQAINRMKE